MMKKIFGISLLAAVSCIQASFNPDEFCRKVLEDIEHAQPIAESLRLAELHKEVLLHSYQGKPFFIRLLDDYATVTEERNQYERTLKAGPDEDAEKNLYQALRMQDMLREVCQAFVAFGKGYQPFEQNLEMLGNRFETDKKKYALGLALLKDTFPEKFPEAELPDVIEVEEDDHQEAPFQYVQPPKDLAFSVLAFEHCRNQLNRDYAALSHYQLNIQVLQERDLAGKTLLRYIAERWLLESPKSEHERPGYRCKAVKDIFKEMLEKGRGDQVFQQNLGDLIECFLERESSYDPLIRSFEKLYPGAVAHFKRTRIPGRRPLPVASPEKIAASLMARLLCAVYEGDEELSTAFSMVQENPSLVQVCDPTGLSLLHFVVRAYEHEYSNTKKKRLALFFDYLLLNGADYTKRADVTMVIPVQKGTPYHAYLADEAVRQQAPSIEEILQDYQKDIKVHQDQRHPWSYRTLLYQKMSAETAEFFKKRLDAFVAGTTARYEGRDGGWLKERMPVKPEPKPAAAPQKKTGPKEKEEDIDELLKRYQNQPNQKSTWESWKPAVKYFVVGAALGGLGYVLYNRSWGDPQEELRQERERLRATIARQSR